MGNPGHYRSLHFDALTGRLDLELAATHIGEGIWIGERVMIDPSVELVGPVYIGAGSSIGRGVRLGERVVIDDHAVVSRSVIGSKSFIGHNSHISNCIVGGGYSVSEDNSLADQMIISDLHYSRPTVENSPTLPIRPSKKELENSKEKVRIK